MAEVLCVGVTHYPKLSGLDENMADTLRWTLQDPDIPEERKDPANWPEAMQVEWNDPIAAAQRHRAALVDGFRNVRRAIDEFAPDVIVIWGDDQYENFREDVIPPVCVLAYDEFDSTPWRPRARHGAAPAGTGGKANIWDEPADHVIHVEGHRTAAKHFTTALLSRDFDMSYAYQALHHPGLSHAFLNAVLFLDYDRTGFPYPVVPVQINCYGRRVIAQRGGAGRLADRPDAATFDPPSPSPRRLFDLGSAFAAAALESPWRVALMASSSWSHAFLVEDSFHIHPATDADRRMYAALEARDFGVWRDLPLDEVERSGEQEMLNWLPLVGAIDALDAQAGYLTFVESNLFNSNKCFGVWSEP
jgi:hypothetical protein